MTPRERVLVRVLLAVFILAAMTVYGVFRVDNLSRLAKQRVELNDRIGEFLRSRHNAAARSDEFARLSRVHDSLSKFIYSSGEIDSYRFTQIVNESLQDHHITIDEYAIRAGDRPKTEYEIHGNLTDFLEFIHDVERENPAWILESFAIKHIDSGGEADYTILIGYRIEDAPDG